MGGLGATEAPALDNDPFEWSGNNDDGQAFLNALSEAGASSAPATAFLAPNSAAPTQAPTQAPPLPPTPTAGAVARLGIVALPLALSGDTMRPSYDVQGAPGVTGTLCDDGQHIVLTSGWFGQTNLGSLTITRDANGQKLLTGADGQVLGQLDGNTIKLNQAGETALHAAQNPPSTEAGGGQPPPASPPGNIRNDGECDENANLGDTSPRTRLPQTGGRWVSGTPGNGEWLPNDPDVLAATGNQPITFRDGRPDFTPWAEMSINVPYGTLAGNSPQDMQKAYELLAERGTIPGATTAAQVEKYLKAHDLTLHHATDTCLQVVPNPLNDSVPHVGSASDLRYQNQQGSAP